MLYDEMLECRGTFTRRSCVQCRQCLSDSLSRSFTVTLKSIVSLCLLCKLRQTTRVVTRCRLVPRISDAQYRQLECGPMPNVMVALPNIGGALCSTPQSLADDHYYMPCSNAAKTQNPLKFEGVSQTPEPISAVSGPKFTISSRHVEKVLLLNKFFSDCRYMP